MSGDLGTFLVVGCGSIGQRHLRNLRTLGVQNLVAVDPRADMREQARSETGALAFPMLQEALDRHPMSVIVATPSPFHIPVALEAAGRGCHLFIEKPLSHTLDHVDTLIGLAARKQLVTMVACNYRFDRGLNLLKRLVDEGTVGTILSIRCEFGFYLPQSHPYEDYRESYPAKRALGGGLLLDRTHEIDYLRWIFGEVQEASCFYAKRSHLDIETEDVVETLFRFKSGVIASVHLDYVEREYRCIARVVGDAGVIEWSYYPNRLRMHLTKTKDWKILLDEPKTDMNEMYVAELRHFLESVQRKTPTCHDLTDGKKILELVLRLKQATTGEAFN